MRYYYCTDGETVLGPIPAENLMQMVTANTVPQTVVVRQEDGTEWTAYMDTLAPKMQSDVSSWAGNLNWRQTLLATCVICGGIFTFIYLLRTAPSTNEVPIAVTHPIPTMQLELPTPVALPTKARTKVDSSVEQASSTDYGQVFRYKCPKCQQTMYYKGVGPYFCIEDGASLVGYVGPLIPPTNTNTADRSLSGQAKSTTGNYRTYHYKCPKCRREFSYSETGPYFCPDDGVRIVGRRGR